VATRELAQRAKEMPGQMTHVVYRGILLAMAAMLIRNAVLLAIFAPSALRASALAFSLMLGTSAILAFLSRRPSASAESESNPPLLNLQSPFSLKSALKFGLILVVIQIAGIFGQQMLGQLGMYITSLLGGLFSSSSAVAAAAALAARGTISNQVAGNCAVIASLTSVVINLPLIVGVGNRPLVWRIAWTVGLVTVVGVLGAILQTILLSGI